MDRQQKLDAQLMQTFSRIFVFVIIFGLIAVAIIKMTKPLQIFHNESVKQEALRLQHVIHILHNQWLIKGKPNELNAQWQQLPRKAAELKQIKTINTTNIQMGKTGFPALNAQDNQGCQHLWQTLMAADAPLLNIKADYQPQAESCHYHQVSEVKNSLPKGAITYQLRTGKVEYLVSVFE